MDSLANYGSDDDYEDSSDEQQKDWRQVEYRKDSQTRQPSRSENQADANYEEVQMDLSEVRIFQQESNDGSRNGKDSREKEGSGDERRRNSPDDGGHRDDQRNRRGQDRYRDRSRSRDKKDEDRTREKKDDRYGSKTDRYGRDHRRDYRDRKSRRSSSKDRRRSDSRDRKRSSSRERRYSRSPKGGRSRRSRSRSRSRGRYGGPQRRYGYPKSNTSRNESTETSTNNQAGNNRFFMPGITGKYRDQIEKRKLLWQKKEQPKPQEENPRQGQSTTAPASTSRGTKIWEATTFAQDQDGKVASKFKRLMGIKGQTDKTPVPPVDIIKKQEELFSSMEQQYEVARTATHTMRGVGLGFSSNYPR